MIEKILQVNKIKNEINFIKNCSQNFGGCSAADIAIFS